MLLKNEDVGFIFPGQQVQIKFAAYPFQKYGMINGIVEHVSPDAMEANGAKDGSANAGYRALVKLARQSLELEGKQLSLNAGMQLVADIKLGRRTVMEYILSPVQKAWQEGGRER
jgi:HlyD family secretion protein